MARYTIQMTVKPAEEVELFTLDPDTKESLEESEDLAEAASDALFDGLDENSYATETVINENDYYNIDELLLEVMDEDGEFDPSKLSFHPSVNLDCQICEDDVFLSCLRYDNEEIYPEHEYEEDDIDHVYYKIMSYDGTRWNDNRWEE